jgi:hypothetical protein
LFPQRPEAGEIVNDPAPRTGEVEGILTGGLL